MDVIRNFRMRVVSGAIRRRGTRAAKRLSPREIDATRTRLDRRRILEHHRRPLRTSANIAALIAGGDRRWALASSARPFSRVRSSDSSGLQRAVNRRRSLRNARPRQSKVPPAWNRLSASGRAEGKRKLRRAFNRQSVIVMVVLSIERRRSGQTLEITL
jgi:hypothetical protein